MLLLHSSLAGHPGGFQVLESGSKAVVNSALHMSLGGSVSEFCGQTRPRGIAGSYGTWILKFRRQFHTAWPSGCTGFHCHQQCRSEEHTSELQSRQYLVCRLLLEKKK